MSLPIAFRRAARAEFDDAAHWYNRRRPGLGKRFTAAVQRILNRIASQPDLYPKVFNELEAPVSKYPYCVYYLEEPGRLVVVSVFHTARDPSVWQGRA